MAVERHEVVVIGGGIGGLAAAWALRDRDVVLLEAEDRLGGRIYSKKRGAHWMTVGAHFIGGLDSPVGQIAAELGLETIRAEGEMATVWMGGKLVRGGRFETYPFRLPLSLGGRISLIRTGLRLMLANRRVRRIIDDPLHGHDGFDGEVVEAPGDAELDAKSFADVLGRMHPQVELIMRTMVNRVTAETHEMSGHFGASVVGNLWADAAMLRETIPGGLSEVVDAMSARMGNRLVTGAPVETVEHSPDGVTVRAQQGGEDVTIQADYVIMATPAPITRRMVSGLSEDKAAALDAVRYGPYIIMSAITDEPGPMPYDDIYMVGVIDRSFCMFYNLMNPLRKAGQPRGAGGAINVHTGAHQAAGQWDMTDEAIRALYLADIEEVFPQTKGIVSETWVHRWEHGYPFWAPGHLNHQAALARPEGRLHFAGDYVGYGSSGPTSHSGYIAARAVRKALETV